MKKKNKKKTTDSTDSSIPATWEATANLYIAALLNESHEARVVAANGLRVMGKALDDIEKALK